MAPRFKGRDEFISGLTMTAAFGALFLVLGSRFWIIPMVFAGLIPAIRGGVRFFTDRRLQDGQRKALPKSENTNVEQQILLVASKQEGKVTPATVALNANVSMEDASNALDEMVKKGYATMDVNDNGTVQYIFPEFIP